MSRKRTLVEHGFRLPRRWTTGRCAGRSSWSGSARRSTCPRPRGSTSRTSRTAYVEQIIRPTGLVDPEVIVKPTKGQIDDLIHEIRDPGRADERVLVTTLTKKMSEDLTDYLLGDGHPDQVPAQRGGHPAPGRAAPRAADGRVRRTGRHQPAARGPRPAGGVAGRDPGRGQGRLPALRTVADPDDRPRGPERVRPGLHVRRQDHRLDGAGDRRDQPAPRQAGRLQHASTASTRSRCGRGSPTSPTCSPARMPTPTSCSAAGRTQSRGKAPVPGGGKAKAGEKAKELAGGCRRPTWPT